MKKLSAALSSLLMILMANSAYAEPPEYPFYATVMLVDTTLDIQSHNYDSGKCIQDEPCSENDQRISVDYEAQDSQSIGLFVSGGWRFTERMGVELQMYSSIDKDEVYGEVRTSIANPDYSTMEVSSSAVGLYGLMQWGIYEEAFLKARFGFANSTANFDTDFASESFSSTHLSYGVSIGQNFGMGALELIYMRYPDVKVSRQEFEDVFYDPDEGPAGSNGTGVTVRRRLTHEIIAIGYTFYF